MAGRTDPELGGVELMSDEELQSPGSRGRGRGGQRARGPLILVVEDDAGLRHIIRFSLEKEGFRVVEAQDGATALELAATEDLALILLDINIPALDGLTVCRRVREFSQVYIILITAMGREEEIVRGLDAGADDYLPKPFGVDQLLARIRAVMRRSRAPEERAHSVYSYEGLVVDLAWHKVTVRGETPGLTPTEYRLLAYLVANAGIVLTQQQILQHVWGDEYAVDPAAKHILHVTIGRLRRKLESDPEHPIYVLTRGGVGYYVPRPE
jgi:DNA-binding response OmpR family regulator